MNDMYADAVLAVILQVESNPTTAQGDKNSLGLAFSKLDKRQP